MDVFKLLDDSIRGVVAFASGIVKTTLTLAIQPISGPHYVWNAYHSKSKQQISPITYLARSLAFASFILPYTELVGAGGTRGPRMVRTNLLHKPTQPREEGVFRALPSAWLP